MEFKDLQDQWQKAREDSSEHIPSSEMMESHIRQNNRLQLNQHLANGLILGLTWICLLLFYMLQAPLESFLGRLGIGLLLGSLGVRILLEIYSYRYYTRIQPTQTTLIKESNMMDYYLFRKKLHDLWSPIILLIYFVGIGLQVPEFANYFPFKQIMIWSGLFLVSGSLIFLLARRGIQKEMDALRSLIKLTNSEEPTS